VGGDPPCHKFGPHYTREHFRLAEWQRCIEGKGDPQGQASRVIFFAGNQQAAAGYVQRFADFRCLPERRRPAKAGGNPELNAMVLAPVHNPSMVRTNTLR
jgi:hypothetical protein